MYIKCFACLFSFVIRPFHNNSLRILCRLGGRKCIILDDFYLSFQDFLIWFDLPDLCYVSFVCSTTSFHFHGDSHGWKFHLPSAIKNLVPAGKLITHLHTLDDIFLTFWQVFQCREKGDNQAVLVCTVQWLHYNPSPRVSSISWSAIQSPGVSDESLQTRVAGVVL